jgi:hypothetical protein
MLAPRIPHISYLCTYDLYSPVHNVLDAGISITKASAQKTQKFPAPSPLALAQVMDMHTKHYAQGCINHRCIGGLCTRDHEGGFRPICGGWRSRCIKELNHPALGPLRCIKELNRPARAAPPPPKKKNLIEIKRKL